jgi:hypothetical protein
MTGIRQRQAFEKVLHDRGHEKSSRMPGEAKKRQKKR